MSAANPNPSRPSAAIVLKRMALVMISYCGAWGGIIQVIDILVNRYVLSPRLMDLCLAISILMLPSVLLLAYFRGIPGPNRWTRIEKVGIPVNVLMLVGILFTLFHGKELGAATQEVTAKDPAGKEVHRQLPKAGFRKRVALFFFENQSGDPELNWVQQAVPMLLYVDLTQDPFVVAFHPYSFTTRMKKAGLDQDSKAPLRLLQEMARSSHLDRFITGSFKRVGDELSIHTELYNTQRGTRETEHTLQNPNLFQLVDAISVQLKRDLDIPKQHIETVTDLPVQEVTTTSMEALREYSNANNEQAFKNSLREAAKHFEAAIAKDSHFALGRFGLTVAYFGLNEIPKAKASLEAIDRDEYRLTERVRFFVKQLGAFLNKDPERRLNIVNQWATLYPDDIDAHETLASLYEMGNQRIKAIQIRQKLLEIDPSNFDQLTKIGALYRSLGEYEKSTEYYKQYIAQFPEIPEGYIRLAFTYEVMGRLPEAREAFQQALTRDVDHVEALLGLGEVQIRMGEFSKALETYEGALHRTKLPLDKSKIYDQEKQYYRIVRNWRKALDLAELASEQIAALGSALAVLNYEVDNIEIQVKAGRTQEVMWRLTERQAKTDDSFSTLFTKIGFVALYLETGETEKALRSLDEVDQLIKQYGMESQRRFVLLNRGEAYERSGDYLKAIDNYQQYLRLVPGGHSAMVRMGRCYRQLQDLVKAEASLQQALKLFPSYPEAHYELSRVFAARSEVARAQGELKVALGGWAQADPQDSLVAEAAAFQASLAKR